MFYSSMIRSSRPEVFKEKCVLKMCSKFTWEHPCRSVSSKKLQSNLIETTLRPGCSPVNLLHIFRTPFPKKTSGWLLLIRPQHVIQNLTVIVNQRMAVANFTIILRKWLNLSFLHYVRFSETVTPFFSEVNLTLMFWQFPNFLFYLYKNSVQWV